MQAFSLRAFDGKPEALRYLKADFHGWCAGSVGDGLESVIRKIFLEMTRRLVFSASRRKEHASRVRYPEVCCDALVWFRASRS